MGPNKSEINFYTNTQDKTTLPEFIVLDREPLQIKLNVLLASVDSNTNHKSESEANNLPEKFIEMLSQIDLGTTQGSIPKKERLLWARPPLDWLFYEDGYPYKAMATDLQSPISDYLGTPTFWCEYLDYFIISTLLKLEAISYYREKKKFSLFQYLFIKFLQSVSKSKTNLPKHFYYKLKSPKTSNTLLEGLIQLVETCNHNLLAPNAFWDLCVDAQKKGCFVHPAVYCILEKQISAGSFKIVFAGMTPEMVENRTIKNNKI